MQRYESYKSSGLDWLGEVPSHWGLKKSKFLWREKEDRSLLGDEELLSVSQYSGVVPRADDSRSESLEDYKRCEPNDLVINIMLAWMSGLGVSKYSGIVSPAYCVYSQLENHNPSYFDYLYRTPQYLAEFARRSKGIVPSRWRMYTEDFGQVLSLLPPREEQDRIVAFLDQKTAEIDAAIAKKEQLIQLLNEQKSSLINNALTRGLKAGAKLRSSGISWIGDIPEDWSVSKLNRIAFYQEGPGLRTWQFTDSGTKVICVTNICPPEISFEKMTKYISAVEYKRRYKHFTVRKGDILLASSGASWGKVAEYKADEELILNTSTIRINSLRSGGVTKDFIKSVLQARYVADQLAGLLTGSCQPNFGPTHLNKLMCAHPKSKVEQDEISTYVEEIAVRTQKAAESILETVSALQEMKSAVCAAVVCGTLKV